MAVTVRGFMRPLQNSGPASVFFLVVVDQEELKQTVLTNVAVLETGRWFNMAAIARPALRLRGQVQASARSGRGKTIPRC
jgi:hypothetical protein